MSWSGDHSSCGKARREAKKDKRRRVKEAKRRERRRDREVTERYGARGHGSCGRKVRHATELYALRAASESMRRSMRDGDGTPLWVYRCEMCGGWHLTSHPDAGTGDYFGWEDDDG